jgi:hypothetical protein
MTVLNFALHYRDFVYGAETSNVCPGGLLTYRLVQILFVHEYAYLTVFRRSIQTTLECDVTQLLERLLVIPDSYLSKQANYNIFTAGHTNVTLCLQANQQKVFYLKTKECVEYEWK